MWTFRLPDASPDPARPDLRTRAHCAGIGASFRAEMCFSMQSFLNVRAELADEKTMPAEVAEVLAAKGFPPIKSAVKQGSFTQSEVFEVTFKSAVPAKLSPTGPGGDRTRAVLQVLAQELGTSPYFMADAPVSVELVQRALSAAGDASPKMWASGEIARRGALRQLPWVLLERVPDDAAAAATHPSAVGSSVAAGASCVEWLPRYDDAFVLLAELRRLAISAGATELDAPLAKLSLACRDQFKLGAVPPRFFLHRAEHATADSEGSNGTDGKGAGAPMELEGGKTTGAVGAGFGSMAPWAAACAGDPRIAEGMGEPWDLVRAFSHVVKARWLMDVLRRTPGDAPRCELSVLLKAHDASQELLAQRGWLPAAIVAPGSSSARLAETFPEELCPNY